MGVVYYNTFPDFTQKGFDMKQYVNTFLTSNVIIDASYSQVHCPLHNTTLTIKSAFKGDEFYIAGRAKYRVNEKNFLLLNVQREHESYIDSDREIESFSLFFYPEYVKQVLNALSETTDFLLSSPFNINTKNNFINFEFVEKLYLKDRAVKKFLTNIKKASGSISTNENYINEQIYFLLEHLFLSQEKLNNQIQKVNGLRESTKFELYKRLSLAKDYIESCYSEKITLSDLSKSACMSEHHLLREFKKYFKVTPHQYLTNVRLNESVSLLRKNKKSISEISEAVGFEYLSSFSQLFRQRYKISPSEFQKKLS